MATTTSPIAVITGASSGIGAASAHALAAAGFDLILGARRTDKLADVAGAVSEAFPDRNVEAFPLDVTQESSVASFCAHIVHRPDGISALVNNAGGAIGADSVENGSIPDWQAMFDVNVLGVLRITKELLPALRKSSIGHSTVVTIGSIAAVEPYLGGAGYNAAKHAVRALTRVLRLELLGEPIRVCEIDPGMVETEFSINRFGGDTERAASVYQGCNPLTAEDIADAVTWVTTRPAHVNVDSMLLLATDQSSAQRVHRRES